MKKALLAVIGAGVVASMASLAFADDDAAYSANAVGVIKYTIPANGDLVCMTLPMHPMETSDSEGRWVWGETSLAQQLPNQSKVCFWTNNSWATFTKKANGKWGTDVATRPIQPGEAIFVRLPDNYSGDDVTVSLLGELPTEPSLTYTLTGSDNLDIRSVSMYPVDVRFGETELAAELASLSKVCFWTNNSWATYTKKANGKWGADVTNRLIKVGEGVFVRSAASSPSVVTNECPFAWDN